MAAHVVDIELGLRNGSKMAINEHSSERLEDAPQPRVGKGPRLFSQSRKSLVSFNPFHYIRNVTLRRSHEPFCWLSDADQNARNDFFDKILNTRFPVTGDESKPEQHIVWYAKFLECRFRGSWITVTREALRNLSPTSIGPQPGEIGTVYNFLSVVAKMLLEDRRNGLAMIDVVDEADNLQLFKDQRDVERAIPNQLVFAAVGWLTMLYDPEPIPRPGQLKIRNVMGSINRPRARTRPCRTFIHYVREGFDGFDQPLFIYLRKFGHLVPEIGAGLSEGPELIDVSYICYYMLDAVADIKIEWVNSLSLHLEFDKIRRILRLFRFPSFCMLMYRDRTSISNVYLDHSRQSGGGRVDVQGEDLTPEYFREVLLSYRLIFGQDKASWKAFSKKILTLEEHWDCSDRHSNDADPMLRILCCSKYDSPNAYPIYEEVDACNDVSQFYNAVSEFPFLGRRILDLQAFVSSQKPTTLRALWYDRHNATFWWTSWAVLLIGGGSLFLAFVQTAFQIWGSISAQKQLAP